MKKSKFTEEQIAYALRQVEGGTAVSEVCRRLGISEQTFYRWKAKFGEMGVSELRKLRQLEEENRRPEATRRRPLARQAHASGGRQKKALKPVQLHGLADFLMAAFGVSIRRACRVLCLNLSTYYYRHRRSDQAALVLRLKELAAARVCYGYLRLHVLLRREGWHVNHKRVYRLYKLEGLSLRLKTPKKRLSRQRVEGPPASAPNECWSMDFVSDRLAGGHRFRALTIVDNFTRECPSIEVDSSLTGARVAAVLEHLRESRGVPARLKVDNGPEFVSRALDTWTHLNGVKLEFSRPGKPTDNAYIESFNGRLRAECLNQQWFETLAQAREEIESWRKDYNERRPHTSLGWIPPQEFNQAWQQARAG